MSPERWTFDYENCPERLLRSEDGEWVKWEDYQAETEDRERLARLLLLLSGDAQRRFDEIERLKKENAELLKDIAYLKLADKFLTWDAEAKQWRWRHEAPKVKDSFLPPK